MKGTWWEDQKAPREAGCQVLVLAKAKQNKDTPYTNTLRRLGFFWNERYLVRTSGSSKRSWLSSSSILQGETKQRHPLHKHPSSFCFFLKWRVLGENLRKLQEKLAGKVGSSSILFFQNQSQLFSWAAFAKQAKFSPKKNLQKKIFRAARAWDLRAARG